VPSLVLAAHAPEGTVGVIYPGQSLQLVGTGLECKEKYITYKTNTEHNKINKKYK